MCAERFLMINLIADAALFAAVGRALGAFRPARALAAGLLCALCAMLALADPIAWRAAPLRLLPPMALSAWISCSKRPIDWLRAFSLLSLSAFLGGGAALCLNRPRLPGPCYAIVGAALLALPGGLSRLIRPVWQVRVLLISSAGRARFEALVDTGNRLREPISGLPVLIAEGGLIRSALPTTGYRLVRYGAVGGEGVMTCFKPTAMWIERGRRRTRAPDAWVAISPGPLPGSARALAPGEFAFYA